MRARGIFVKLQNAKFCGKLNTLIFTESQYTLVPDCLSRDMCAVLELVPEEIISDVAMLYKQKMHSVFVFFVDVKRTNRTESNGCGYTCRYMALLPLIKL